MWPGPLGATMMTLTPLGGCDEAEMDAQAMGEEEGLARREVGRDVRLIHAGLAHVGQRRP